MLTAKDTVDNKGRRRHRRHLEASRAGVYNLFEKLAPHFDNEAVTGGKGIGSKQIATDIEEYNLYRTIVPVKLDCCFEGICAANAVAGKNQH